MGGVRQTITQCDVIGIHMLNLNNPRRATLALASLLFSSGLAVHAQSPITNGLVAYWNFDAKDFKDSFGTFDGTANGSAPITFVDGKAGFGQAIELDGNDQFIE